MLHAARWITYPQRFIFVSITIMRLIISILVFFFFRRDSFGRDRYYIVIKYCFREASFMKIMA